MEKFVHRRGDIFGDVVAPGIPVDDFAIGFALGIKLEKDRDTIEAEAVFSHFPAPFIRIQADEINTVKSVDQTCIVRIQTGRDCSAGRSPIGIELDYG